MLYTESQIKLSLMALVLLARNSNVFGPECNDAYPHFTVPTHLPMGLAEYPVQTFKQGISKLEGTSIQDRIAIFLSNYQIMPQTSTVISPSELMMGRKVRTWFDLIHPDITKKMSQNQDKMIKLFDRACTFKVGDRLYACGFRGKLKWISVTVTRWTIAVFYVMQSHNMSHTQCDIQT